MPARKRTKINTGKAKSKESDYSESASSSDYSSSSDGDDSSSSSSSDEEILKMKRKKAPEKAPKKKKADADILDEKMPLPKRNKVNELVFADHPEFRPNLTPAEVLQKGSFGGTYFRPITSSATGERYKGVHKEFPDEWFKGLDIKSQVISSKYDKSVNTFGVKCGGSLEMWEESGWMRTIDPYGWFQWYCRFYMGRRSTDDERQIKRQLGVCGAKGRFRNQLIGKCARGGTTFDDASISPVIRQTLQHWGYTLTKKDADKYVKLKKLPPLRE
jgi:hypothetical protein